MIAYTYGVYDLFHIGHINLFKRIKENCDKLIVGIHNDDQVITYKKPPIINYKQRLEIVRSCKYVDQIYENADLVITDEILNKLNANYVFAGIESEEYIKKYYQVNEKRLKLIDRTNDICTSDIINKIIKTRNV
jgi:cytidyltransferase-like protein